MSAGSDLSLKYGCPRHCCLVTCIQSAAVQRCDRYSWLNGVLHAAS